MTTPDPPVMLDWYNDYYVEGTQFLHDNRYGEACGAIAAFEAGALARYLYLISPNAPSLREELP